MSKKLNVESISNELAGSAFFPQKKPSPPPTDIEEETSAPDKKPVPPVRDVRPVPPVSPVPLKRVMKQRWPVDIYQDQYESLQELALEERKRGGVGSMSAMVREALDKLIAEKRRK